MRGGRARSPGAMWRRRRRITDVVLGALAKALPGVIPAASQGTMNNVTLGGVNARTGRPFAYYETAGGGMGGRPGQAGISGVHTHMSNTRNTPVEAFEQAFPLRFKTYGTAPGQRRYGRSLPVAKGWCVSTKCWATWRPRS